jgi:hypothetical protein
MAALEHTPNPTATALRIGLRYWQGVPRLTQTPLSQR